MTLLLAGLAVLAVLVVPGRAHVPPWGAGELVGKQGRPGAAGGMGRAGWAGRAGGAGGLSRLGLLSRRGRRADPRFADLVELLAPALRAGASPDAALGAVGSALDPGSGHADLVRRLREMAAAGGPVSSVWQQHADASASPEADFVAQAWLLSEQTGAPIADALDCAVGVLREHERVRQRLDSAAAGPRASMWVLCLLPMTGPGVGAVFGLSPSELYLQSPASAASLVTGVLLACAGLVWSRALLRRALRPRPVSS